MEDSEEKIKVISSLPPRLQSPEDENDPDPIINMQIAVYEAHIDDLQRRIQRLHVRNEQVEKLCELISYNYKYKNAEDEKEFVEINIGIANETKRMNEDKKKLAELEKLRKSQKMDHLNKVMLMKEAFENKRIEFYSQIKELNAKINTIDNYKVTDQSLKAKYRAQNESISNKEYQLQDTLNEMEFKSKIHKENLKKEAYKKILTTSDKFQFDMKIYVPLTVQRLMRENIVLQSELFRLRNDRNSMSSKLSVLRNNTIESKGKIKDDKLNTRHQIIASKVQNLLIKKLKTAYSTVKEILCNSYEAPADYEDKHLKLLEDIKHSEFFNCDYRRRELEVVFHREMIKYGLTNNLKYKTSFILNNLCNTLSNFKKCINSAISIGTMDDREDYKKSDFESFVFYLLDIIKNYESKKLIPDSESVETVADVRRVYDIGDLGFEPKHVEIDQIKEEIEKDTSIHSASTTLQELDKSSNKHSKEGTILSSEKSLYDDVSMDSSVNSNTIASQTSISTKGSLDYLKQEMEYLHTMSDNEEGESEYELQDKYDYLDYGQ